MVDSLEKKNVAWLCSEIWQKKGVSKIKPINFINMFLGSKFWNCDYIVSEVLSVLFRKHLVQITNVDLDTDTSLHNCHSQEPGKRSSRRLIMQILYAAFCHTLHCTLYVQVVLGIRCLFIRCFAYSRSTNVLIFKVLFSHTVFPSLLASR